MAELSVSKKNIKDLLNNNKADFLIPDYQRPYAWDAEKECQTLWEDVFDFAFPENDYSNFDTKTAEYYLGPIVTFTNNKKQSEIIDGQQRLTTIMLLLRAFYSRFEKIEEAITYAIMSDGHGRTLCCSGLCCDLPISLERLSHKGTIGRAVHQRRG